MDSRQQPQKATMATKHQFIDLRTVLTRYIYHWPLFALGLIIAFAAAYTYINFASPVYELNATILVKDEKKSPEEKSALPELDQSSSPKNAEAEIEILKSKNLIGKVVNDLQLWTSYKIKEGLKTSDLYDTAPFKLLMVQKKGSLNEQHVAITIKSKSSFEFSNLSGQKQEAAFNQVIHGAFGSWVLKPSNYLDQYIGSTIDILLSDPETVTNDYAKTIDAHLLDKLAPTIGLSVTDEVPQRGEDFLNGLISAYNEAAAGEQKRTTKSTIDFIDNRLSSLTGELNSAEKQVEGYRSSQGITDINSQSKAYLESVQGNDVKLNEVNVQLNIINGIEQYVNSNSNGSAPATIGISDPSLNSLIEKLSELQLKRTSLLATTPEQNPLFEPINKQIALTKASIKETVKGIKAALLNSKRELEAFNGKFESSIKDIPGQERQFVGMKRQQSIKENLYIYLLQKREELALSYASTFADARIVDKANVGDLKWPKKPLIFAIALLCGLGLPFMLIYFRSAFNNHIISRREIEQNVASPILGELSFDENKQALVINDKHTLIGEQFRTLRTNLHYLHNTSKGKLTDLQQEWRSEVGINEQHPFSNGNGRVTLLTSSVSKEGKSFVSTNLAASLAATGRKTVILEMDLRKPKISSIFGLSKEHAGISNFLASDINVEMIIQPSVKVENLDIIGAGTIQSEPSELLESSKLVDLIQQLKNIYDDVIIDTPPLHLVTDAMIIGRVADVSLYIVRQGYTVKDEFDFIDEIYQTEKLPHMNIVFNGIKNDKYGYGYNYDNSYYNTGAPTKASFNTRWNRVLSRL